MSCSLVFIQKVGCLIVMRNKQKHVSIVAYNKEKVSKLVYTRLNSSCHSLKQTNTDLHVHLFVVHNNIHLAVSCAFFGKLSTLQFMLVRSRGAFWVSEGPHLPADVWDDGTPHVAVAVGTSLTQPFHQGSEGYLQCEHLAPLPGARGSLVWGCGRQGA